MKEPPNPPQIPDEKAREKLQIKAVKKKVQACQTEFENRQSQEEYEAALASFNTVKKEGMRMSLNGLPPTEAGLKKLEEQKQQPPL